jgi:branched-subunit amino acid aminotransferase/4-amino-4-deoxychorismate lyase
MVGASSHFILVDGTPVPPDDGRVPPWTAGFCPWIGVYDTLRWPPPPPDSSQEAWLQIHARRLQQSYHLAELPPTPLASPDIWVAWTQQAIQLSPSSHPPFRVRWHVAYPPGSTTPVQVVFLIPDQDPDPDPAWDKGVILIDGPDSRTPGDRRWCAKRTGHPVDPSAQLRFPGSSLPFEAASQNFEDLLQRQNICGFLPRDGSSVVQHTIHGTPCETTWGCLAWLQWDAKTITVPPLLVPRLPSITLSRALSVLHEQGFQLVEGDLIPEESNASGQWVLFSAIRTVVPVVAWVTGSGHIRWHQNAADSRPQLNTLRDRLRHGPMPPPPPDNPRTFGC